MSTAAFSELPYREGVGIMLINADNMVFVAKRIDSISEAWQMPQGGIDEGEEPQVAAFRELMEQSAVAG
jgi:putative (di)nucleoside polyphosphate hydrolase